MDKRPWCEAEYTDDETGDTWLCDLETHDEDTEHVWI